MFSGPAPRVRRHDSKRPEGGDVVNGYELVTSDDEKVGTIVGQTGDFVIVENGLLRRHRYVVPAELTSVEEERGVVRTTVVKEIIRQAPEADGNGAFDEGAVRSYYGLSAAEARSWTRPEETSAIDEDAETTFPDTRRSPDELGGGFEQERLVRGGL
jgi:hypothetical protein